MIGYAALFDNSFADTLREAARDMLALFQQIPLSGYIMAGVVIAVLFFCLLRK